jgi:ribonucleoside-diphosphate reductase alpha chain
MVKQTPKEAVIYFRGDEMAADVWFNKYALRDKDGNVLEKTPHDTHARMASELVKYSQRYNDPLTFNECMSWFEGFNYIVPQGSIMYGLGNPYSLTSLSNCFVIDPPKDSYPSIMRTDADMVELMKRRGGVGTDVSNIRGIGEFIDNAAASSCGVTPIMERYSNTTREVGQGGRRGALMLSIDVNHSDIRDFINYKTNLKKCTGANVSVRVDDRFMNSVISGDEEVNKTFDMLIDANRRSAEPGILFWDTILRESPFAGYKGWEEKSTNPCSEIALTDGDSCRLLAINFYGFVDNKFSKSAKFDYSKFRDACYAAVKMMDSVVDAEIDKISQIIAKIESDPEPEFEKAYSLKLWNHVKMRAEQGRRTGIGMTGLGDTLAALGLKYGTRTASDFAEELFKTMSDFIYQASQELAKTRGAAPLFNEEFDKKSAFLSRKGFAGVPRRHIGLLTCAPTGTVSMMTQTTSGIEPLFRAFYKRKKKDEKGTIIDVVGDKFVEYFVIHQPFKDWLSLNNLKHDTLEELEEGFKLSPWYGATAESIDNDEKVYMQSWIQQHIDHSISVTMNLPEGTTNETIRELYINAWQRGCKGLTVYVDGSREGVLNDVKSSGEKQNNIPVQPANAPATPLKRPKKLDGEVQFFRVGNEHWCAFVGLLEGKPYEVFLGNATNYPYLKKGSISEGVIEKTDDGYQFIANKVDGYGLTISGLGSMFNKEYWNYAKSVSGMLRNGMSIPAVIDIVEGLFDNDSLHSFKNGVIRVLKKYIKDGEKPTKHSDCPNCDNGNFVYQEGCLTCLNCGYSKCS